MSEHKHGIFDTLKSMVVDETPDTPSTTPAAAAPVADTQTPVSPFSFSPATAAAPAMAPSSAPQSLSAFVGSAGASTSAESEDFYQKLLAKTDFDKTDIALTLNKFLAPLQPLQMSTELKFRTAVATAKANANVTEDAILNTFDSLKATLTAAGDSFKTKVAAFEAKEIQARQERLTQIQQQIQQLQTEQTQVTTDLAAAQAKDAATQSAFNSALARRGAEIDGQKVQFASMLKS